MKKLKQNIISSSIIKNLTLNSVSLTKLKKVLFWTLLLTTFIIYFFSAARFNTGYADSDEIITAGYHLSTAHPPGYPLSVILTKLFITLPIGGLVAFRANLVNTVIHSLTIAFLFLLSFEVSSDFNDKKKKNLFIAFFGSFTLALSSLFWLYSSLAEIAPLGNLFTVLTLLYAFKWRKNMLQKIDSSKLALLTSLFWGLGLSHLQTLILLGPGLLTIFIFTLIKTKKIKTYSILLPVLLLVIALAFFIPNLLLLYFNALGNDTTWWFEQDLSGWIGHIFRKVYGGFYVENDRQIPSYFDTNRSLNYYFNRLSSTLPYYLKYLVHHFSLFPLFLLIVAFVRLYQENKSDFYILLAIFIFPSFVFPLYLSAPEMSNDLMNIRMQTGITHRQYLIGETVIGLVIILGLNAFIKFLSEYIHNKKYKQLLVLLYIPFLIYLLTRNYKMGTKRDFDIAYNWAVTTLNQLEPDSAIICSADFSCYALLYVNEVENIRPDVTVLTKNSYYRKNFLKANQDYTGYYYLENPYYLANLISWNVSKRPTYITDISSFYLDFIGLEGGPFYLIPNGYSIKVDYKIPEKIQDFDYSVSEALIAYPTSSRNYWQLGLGDYFANQHMLIGTLYANLRMTSIAKYHYDLAVALTKEQIQKPKNLLAELEHFKGNDDYQLGKEASSSTQLYASGLALLEEGKLQEAYEQIRRAMFADPLDFEIRLHLADLYKVNGYFDIAKQEYNNVLTYYPENQKALEGFISIQSIEN